MSARLQSCITAVAYLNVFLVENLPDTKHLSRLIKPERGATHFNYFFVFFGWVLLVFLPVVVPANVSPCCAWLHACHGTDQSLQRQTRGFQRDSVMFGCVLSHALGGMAVNWV